MRPAAARGSRPTGTLRRRTASRRVHGSAFSQSGLAKCQGRGSAAGASTANGPAWDARSLHASDGTVRATAGPMTRAHSLAGVLFALLAAVGCTIKVTPKDKAEGGAGDGEEAGAIVCCRTEPEAGPEGCLCEPEAKDIIMVTGTSCSASTTV